MRKVVLDFRWKKIFLALNFKEDLKIHLDFWRKSSQTSGESSDSTFLIFWENIHKFLEISCYTSGEEIHRHRPRFLEKISQIFLKILFWFLLIRILQKVSQTSGERFLKLQENLFPGFLERLFTGFSGKSFQIRGKDFLRLKTSFPNICSRPL